MKKKIMEQEIEKIDFNHTLTDVGNLINRFNEMANLVNEMNKKISRLSERLSNLENNYFD